jgi:hypothetical protein
MDWAFDGFWQKAKLYADHALKVDQNSPLFPFWATLSLEFLGRACLARIHPSLLADPRDDTADNLLYACGLPSPKYPKSIVAKTVFLRCERVVPGFTKKEMDICLSLIDRRNRELHTGAAAFEDFPTELWLANYYRVTGLLLTFVEKDLADMFGEAEAQAAEEMISAAEAQIKKQVFDAVAAVKNEFKKLNPEMQAERRQAGSVRAAQLKKFWGRLIACPGCSAQSLVTGKTIRSTEPRLEDGLILQDHVVLPTQLECFSCGLTLDDHAKLHALEIGGEYTATEEHDPVEFHHIDPADYFEPDYGND